jgi:hypothetical protein
MQGQVTLEIAMPALRRGTTRVVLVVGPLAFKFARHDRGVLCNLFEANLYRRTTTPRRRDMLCPVIACSRNGAVLVMKAATPLDPTEHEDLRANLPDWDYGGPGDDECPFEPKPEDWGRLKGRLVAVDYSAPVL